MEHAVLRKTRTRLHAPPKSKWISGGCTCSFGSQAAGNFKDSRTDSNTSDENDYMFTEPAMPR
eukprot:3412004-Alexandrium_andersonii.AAC.1